MSSQGCLPSPLPWPTFWHLFFLTYFGTKLLSISFSLRPEEVLLVLTSQKPVSYMYGILSLPLCINSYIRTTEWETFTSNQLNFYFKGGVIIFVSTLIQIPNKLKPTQLLFMGRYNVSISTSVQIPDQFNSYLLGEGVILCLHLHLHFFYIPLPVWTMTYQPLSLAPYPMLSPPLLFKSQSKSVPTYRGREFPKQWQPINVSPLFVHRQWKVYNTVNS